MKARLVFLATMSVVVGLAACGDPTNVTAHVPTSVDTLSRQGATARRAGTAAVVHAGRERLAIHRVTAVAPKVHLRGDTLRVGAVDNGTSAFAVTRLLTLPSTAPSTRASGRVGQHELRDCDHHDWESPKVRSCSQPPGMLGGQFGRYHRLGTYRHA